jgi:hypothetical protein
MSPGSADLIARAQWVIEQSAEILGQTKKICKLTRERREMEAHIASALETDNQHPRSKPHDCGTIRGESAHV